MQSQRRTKQIKSSSLWHGVSEIHVECLRNAVQYTIGGVEYPILGKWSFGEHGVLEIWNFGGN